MFCLHEQHDTCHGGEMRGLHVSAGAAHGTQRGLAHRAVLVVDAGRLWSPTAPGGSSSEFDFETTPSVLLLRPDVFSTKEPSALSSLDNQRFEHVLSCDCLNWDNNNKMDMTLSFQNSELHAIAEQ